jgi:c(7)-type cytochrome triheme protein
MILVAAMSGFLASGLLAGCSANTTQELLQFFFDGVDTPPPPTRRVRRDLLQEIEDLKRQLADARAAAEAGKEGAAEEQAALPAEQAKTWEDAADLLPKDQDGNVDWVQALKAGAIAPRPGPDRRAAEQPVLSLDVELVPEAGEGFKAVFSHEAHTALLACPSCHPALFEMKGGATPITMEKINAGEQCGVCHGTVAFSASACARCHPAMGG